MKNVLIATLIFLAACSASKQTTSTNYTVVPDSETKVLKGIINRSVLESDTSFNWFKDNMKYGQADAAAIAAFQEKKDQFTMIVFGGTWCHDTQNLLPVFYRLVDKSGYPESRIQLIMTDRKKETIKDLHKKYNITNVPTFIVFHNGKEVGRVVEYGSMGAIDKELGGIVSSIH